MDTVMLGQLDETALSASSMAAQVHNLFHFMCMGLGMGASVLIARYWGAEEHASLRKTLVLMYRFCLLTALVLTKYLLNLAADMNITSPKLYGVRERKAE